MSQIMIPTSQAEAPVGDGSGDFPKGSWCGIIDTVRIKDLPPWADVEGRGYGCDDGEVLSIQFGRNRPLDGQDDCGEKKHFVDFVIRDGDETCETVDVTDRGCASWQLQKGTRMLANLGAAMGQTEVLENEDGESMTCLAEDFLDNLRSGAFDNEEVAFNVFHKSWTKKAENGETPKSGVEVVTKEFFQAV